jgi:hypothetical protein
MIFHYATLGNLSSPIFRLAALAMVRTSLHGADNGTERKSIGDDILLLHGKENNVEGEL